MTGQGDRGAEREVERWLRREGLPAFVRRESRGDLLLARTLERQSRHEEAAGVRRVLVALTGDARHAATHAALG